MTGSDGFTIKPAEETTGDLAITSASAVSVGGGATAGNPTDVGLSPGVEGQGSHGTQHGLGSGEASVPPPLPGLHYAPYGSRVAAFFTDGVLEAILQGALSLGLGTLAAAFLRGAGLASGESFLALTGESISSAYGLLWWGCGAFNRVVIQWYYGGTLGKLIFGLRVAELDGGEVRFWTNLKRYIFGWVSLVPFGLGFVAPLWTVRKQGFHDIIARSVVLERH